MKAKYLVAQRNEHYEQYLSVVEVEFEDKKKAYNKINNILRSKTSKSTFERSRKLPPEIETIYNALREYTKYTASGWGEVKYSDGRTYEELHRDLYKFLRCPRDLDSLCPRILDVASAYGHLPNLTDGGYPVAYYLQDMGELFILCGDCANKLEAGYKEKLIDYDVLEGDTRDHGEVYCETCDKTIVYTEFTVKITTESGEETVYTGEDRAEACRELEKAKVLPGILSAILYQDEVQIEPETADISGRLIYIED